MDTGSRMKGRRKALGYSAEKVASELGLSPATIYRYEKGDIKKMPGSLLEPLADLLSTTPAYLMGWTDDPEDYEKADEIDSLPVEWIDHFGGDVEAAVKAYRAVEADRAAEANKKPSQKESLSAKDVERMLVEFGWIQPGEDLTDSDMDYLMAIGDLITLWFANRKKS